MRALESTDLAIADFERAHVPELNNSNAPSRPN
jgi:hypothetical protein